VKKPKPMRIARSPLTGQFYAFQSFKLAGNGKGFIITGKKWDVTADIKAIVEEGYDFPAQFGQPEYKVKP